MKVKIKLSKTQWEKIGKKANWLKTSNLDNDETENEDSIEYQWKNRADDDIIINHNGEAYCTGKLIAKPFENNPDFKAIANYMKKNQYWPNVWEINDHGNVSLYTVDENGNAKMVGGIV